MSKCRRIQGRFSGREEEALEEAIRALAELSDRTYSEVEDALDDILTPTLTESDIDKHKYTLCHYTPDSLSFIVPTTLKVVATSMAREFLLKRKNIKMKTSELCTVTGSRSLAPRARQLLSEGEFYTASLPE